MNHLLRRLAPISDAGWEWLDDEAGERLRGSLAARRLGAFSGPHGGGHSGADPGRGGGVAAPPRGWPAPGPPWGGPLRRPPGAGSPRLLRPPAMASALLSVGSCHWSSCARRSRSRWPSCANTTAAPPTPICT